MYVSDFKYHLQTEPPCDVCPRNGVCVPKVQCPAHVNPGSSNPRCHIDGQHVGVCCFTGSNHFGNNYCTQRVAASIEDLNSAHQQSKKKLDELVKRADTLLNEKDTVVKESDPSYGHHMVRYTKTQELGRIGFLSLLLVQELKSREAISAEDLGSGIHRNAEGSFCLPPPLCPRKPSKYRNLDGTCNNSKNPSWGAIFTGFERLLPPEYRDGTWAFRLSVTNGILPNSRAVSNAVILDGHYPSRSHNAMFTQFGQFITHDISSGVVFTTGNDSAISCCSKDGQDVLPLELQHWACAAISISPKDPFYSQFNRRCINFVRGVLAPSHDCLIGYAKQMNGVSHFLDLSHIYGNSEEKLASLRAPGGLLKTFDDFGRELPPLTKENQCLTSNNVSPCFDSGDNHANQILSLTALHTLFTREHNRIARALYKLNPHLDEEALFFETRRIVQAEFQNIVYKEWLPLLIGPKMMKMFKISTLDGYSQVYDPSTNPSITAEFSGAAMRFGHSIVDGKMLVFSPQTSSVDEILSLPETMFLPSRLRLKYFLDRLLTGMCMQPMQNVDPFMTTALSRYLFRGGNPFGHDLAAINIQRGRDYGLRPFNDYRVLIGSKPFTSFKQFPAKTAQRLSSVYTHPHDIDLWVGGLLEKPIDGGILGATFSQIIGDQFTKLKKGDRYFYEHGPDVNPGAFTPSQLSEIKKVTLARIICDNSDHIELLTQSPYAFLRRDLSGNQPVPCDSTVIPQMDLNKFRDL
ncbi:chorion peroxidase-like [Leptidea sinapis]|uniref:chorion peroxidase-like n=1 Tax=Leptidea sinapis TaxID=189913 RepID=UPI0021C39E89|nr:chorion peroxidase-like [Leptidea sinapis]